MRENIVIVGGSSGLGLATARELAAAGRQIVVTGRNFSSLTEHDRAAGITEVALDLGRLTCADELVERLDALGVDAVHALLLNAGQQAGRRSFTDDGYEATMAVNVLAPLAILDRLLPRLVEGARVVWTASGTHDPAVVSRFPERLESATLDELLHPTGPFRMRDGLSWYATSKLCVVRLVPELARRLAPVGVRINGFDPGLMPETGLARGYPALVRGAFRVLTPVMLLAPGAHRVATSARHLAGLVTQPRYAEMSGAYVVDDHTAGTSIASYDPIAAQRMYAEARAHVRAVHLPE